MAQSTWFELRTGEGAEVGWKKGTNDVGVEIKEGFSAGKDSNCFLTLICHLHTYMIVLSFIYFSLKMKKTLSEMTFPPYMKNDVFQDSS